ncbi:tRNA dihydrouridine synthase DusB [Chitinivibrio alkaliphilus]|uniref:tRNA-dihydrouridine synthase n=1 Tax=Chitinivibrio alkaliphilus ACht1 TaxID=1313304 RepID=U7D9E3_9BACT|nr:tRNA dihydrouridine synthase DusB [Chitinivibrio alkaliphilus]ERP32201.1 tRNA-dihydrouridine synthase [Chitinivibrio alkaliphilus ACht1]
MIDFTDKLFLAPMAGVSDPVYRQICREMGADIVLTEMVSATGLHYGSEKTADLARVSPADRPCGVQLFGADPDEMGRAVAEIQERFSPDFIDLNAGCPVKKVVSKNGGAALLQQEKLFSSIIRAMVRESSVPVTVKIRSGWTKDALVDCLFGTVAEDAGAALVTLHPRTRSMGYSGRADWSRIARLKETVSIPVVGNGDITTPEEARQMYEETGCDSLMLARGTYGAPWIFSQIRSFLEKGTYTPVSIGQRLDMAKYHYTLYEEQYGPRRTLKDMRKHLAWYIKGIPGATRGRDAIFRALTRSEIFASIDSLYP